MRPRLGHPPPPKLSLSVPHPSHLQGCLGTRGINLEEEAAKAPCQEYIDYMHSCNDQPYPIHVTVLWAIEKAYHEAWHAHQPPQPNQAPYDYATERWASEPFSKYVKELQAVADDALASATRDERWGLERGGRGRDVKLPGGFRGGGRMVEVKGCFWKH